MLLKRARSIRTDLGPKTVDEQINDLFEEILSYIDELEDPALRDQWIDALTTFTASGDVGSLASLTKWRRPVVDLDEFLFGAAYLNQRPSDIYPGVLKGLHDLEADGYDEIVELGAIGIGKTTLANLKMGRSLYKISCMQNPHRVYGIGTGTPIVFTIQSVRLSTARKVVFGEFGRYIRESPYFRTRFMYDRMITSSMEFHEKNISILPVSSSGSAAISMNVIGGQLDECLIGETNIALANGGLCNIADIRQGDKVLTISSDNKLTEDRVLSARSTGVRPIYKVAFSDGTHLTGTGNHPIATTRGWVYINAIQPSDIVYASAQGPRKVQALATEAIGASEPQVDARTDRQPRCEIDREQSSQRTRAEQAPNTLVPGRACNLRGEAQRADAPTGDIDQFSTRYSSQAVSEQSASQFCGCDAHTVSTRESGAVESRIDTFGRNKEVNVGSSRTHYARNRDELFSPDTAAKYEVHRDKEIPAFAIGSASSQRIGMELGDSILRVREHSSSLSRQWRRTDNCAGFCGGDEIWKEQDYRSETMLPARCGPKKIASRREFCPERGNSLRNLDRKVVTVVEFVGFSETFNFETSTSKNYFANGILVHNCNFMQKTIKSKSSQADEKGEYDQAKQLYNTLASRRKSRFLNRGDLPGELFLISSSRFPDDFTEIKAAESTMRGGDDEQMYVFGGSQWDIKGRDNREFFTAEEFTVQIGNESFPSKVIQRDPDTGEDTELVAPGCDSIRVPMTFYKDFNRDPDNELRNIAGRTTLSTTPFFTHKERLKEAFELGAANGYVNPMRREEFELSQGLPDLDRRLTRTDVKAPRHAHIDLGLTHDACGFAVGHVAGYKVEEHTDENGKKVTEVLPVLAYDVICRIVPPMGGEIELEQVRRLLRKIKNRYHIPIESVSFDGFQSVDSRQLLHKAGFKTSKISVEAIEPWRAFRDAVYDGRVLLPEHKYLRKELADVERKVDNKKEKVDHRPNGTKDVADAVVGVAAFLLRRRITWTQAQYSGGRTGLFLQGTPNRSLTPANVINEAEQGRATTSRRRMIRRKSTRK